MAHPAVLQVDGSGQQVMEGRTIVQHLGAKKAKRCGYCKSSMSSLYHAMWAHSLTPQDYVNLLFRGWSGAGRFLYRPVVNEYWPTCCPRYTIRCHALDFQLSKSQQKVLRRFNGYLRKPPVSSSSSPQMVAPISSKVSPRRPSSSSKDCGSGVGNCSKSLKKNSFEAGRKKTLEDYLRSSSMVDNHQKSKFRVKTMRVETKNLATASFEKEYALYCEYQVKVLGKNGQKIISTDQFIRYFCDSPFFNNEAGTNKDIIYGRYHQLYYLDKKLVAMSVFDILPKCVSSVNFFYSPTHSFLSLGHLRVLREIWLVRQLHARHPDIQYYLMGSYIINPSSKSKLDNFAPSYLLCPENFSWHLLDHGLKVKLNATPFKYRLSSETSEETEEPISLERIRLVRGNGDARIMSYATYLRVMGDWAEYEVRDYAELVGEACASSMIVLLHDFD